MTYCKLNRPGAEPPRGHRVGVYDSRSTDETSLPSDLRRKSSCCSFALNHRTARSSCRTPQSGLIQAATNRPPQQRQTSLQRLELSSRHEHQSGTGREASIITSQPPLTHSRIKISKPLPRANSSEPRPIRRSGGHTARGAAGPMAGRMHPELSGRIAHGSRILCHHSLCSI